jgi:hypothetical protein
MVASWHRCKQGSRRISIVENRNLVTPSENHYRAMTGEDIEDLMFAAVQ